MEIVKITFYIINQSPSTTINLKLPIRIWTGKPADYSCFHIFWSLVYMMYNTQEVSELNLKFKKYVSGVIIFSSVRFLSKKVTKTSFLKKNRNRFKSTCFGSIILGKKTDSNCFGSVFPVWLGFFQFGSVFSIWLCFFPGFFRFRFGSVFLVSGL